MRASRRSPARLRLAAGAGLIAAATVLAACSGSSSPKSSEPTRLQARPAADFIDSVGVNVHLGYGDTSYANLDGVLDRLGQLGIRHVRDSLPLQPSQRLMDGLAALHTKGITADLAVAQTPRRVKQLPSPQEALDSLDGLDPDVRRVVDAVEAPNEWDLQGGSEWVSQISDFTRSFGSLLRNDPAWRSVTYVGPSTGRVERVALLPDLGSGSGHIDVANLHSYPAGGPPEKASGYLAQARKVAPGKPLWVTELGYHTAVNQIGRQPAVTESQQGSYLTRQLLENFAAGVARSYVYELAEQKPDPGLADQEEHFGLLTPELTPKPAFTQLKALLDGVRDPQTAGAPVDAAFGVSVQAPGDPVGSLLLRRSDGSYRLVLWARGTLALDGTSTASAARVDIQLTGGNRKVYVRRTTKGTVEGSAGSAGAASTTSRITGRLGGDPVIVDIAPAPARGSAQASVAEVTFDTSGLAPGDDLTPHGNVSRQPDRVKTVVIAVSAFVLGGGVVTMCIWISRKRRHRGSPA